MDLLLGASVDVDRNILSNYFVRKGHVVISAENWHELSARLGPMPDVWAIIIFEGADLDGTEAQYYLCLEFALKCAETVMVVCSTQMDKKCIVEEFGGIFFYIPEGMTTRALAKELQNLIMTKWEERRKAIEALTRS
jgi:hypothetical protein